MVEEIISIPQVADSGMVLDQEVNEWVNAWQRCFRRQKVFDISPPGNSIPANTNLFSPKIYIAPYRHLELFISMVTDAGWTLRYAHQFSVDGNEWYYVNTGNTWDFDSSGLTLDWKYLTSLINLYLGLFYRLRFGNSTSSPENIKIQVLADSW